MGIFKKSNKHSISDLIKGIQHAADSARKITIHNHIELMDKFFDVAPDGSFHAKMVDVSLSQGDSKLLVPLITLIPPSSMRLEKLNIKMKVNGIGKPKNTDLKSIDGHNTSRTHFNISSGTSDKKNVIDIDATFGSSELPEALMKIIDKFTESIKPVNITDTKKINIIKGIHKE